MYEIIKIEKYCVLLNIIKGSKTCKVETFIADGFINESRETCGISHLIEHILTEAWKKCFKKGCSLFWKNYGVLTSAETNDNTIRYFIEGLAEYTPKMIDFITSIVTDPHITKKRLKKEKIAVVNELLSHDETDTHLFDGINKAVYVNKGLVLSENRALQLKNLKNFTLDDIKEWIKVHYCYNNTIFIISGDFNKKKVVSQMTTILKRSTLHNYCPHQIHPVFQRGCSISYVPEKEKDNTKIVLAFPDYIDTPNKTLFYTDFFTLFIDNGVESFLMQELREKKDLIYNTSVESNIFPRASLLSIEISTKNNQITKVIREALKILKKIAKGKFSQETMNDIKRKFMVNYYQSCLNNDFYTDFYGTQLMNQLQILDKNAKIYTYEEVANLITHLTKKQFITFVNDVLNFENMKIIYQGQRKISLTSSILEKWVVK
jgi:zinc protease